MLCLPMTGNQLFKPIWKRRNKLSTNLTNHDRESEHTHKVIDPLKGNFINWGGIRQTTNGDKGLHSKIITAYVPVGEYRAIQRVMRDTRFQTLLILFLGKIKDIMIESLTCCLCHYKPTSWIPGHGSLRSSKTDRRWCVRSTTGRLWFWLLCGKKKKQKVKHE